MIKVVSYNIRKALGTDRRRSPERILDVLCELDADVVALQEADRRVGSRVRVLGSRLLDEYGAWVAAPVAQRTASMGWHGNALLVRRDATLVDCTAIHLPSLEPRGAVMADVGLDVGLDGAVVRMVGMHLDLSGLWRRKQARAILDHVATWGDPRPSVLMGDLNEWSASGGCLRDFARDYRFAPTGPSFHARRPIGRLDRIMVSPEWRIVDCGVHATPTARMASDHLPIWATLELA